MYVRGTTVQTTQDVYEFDGQTFSDLSSTLSTTHILLLIRLLSLSLVDVAG